MNNQSVLSGKCPPGWDIVGDTCYFYIGAPMDFFSAREFCRVSFFHFENFLYSEKIVKIIILFSSFFVIYYPDVTLKYKMN